MVARRRLLLVALLGAVAGRRAVGAQPPPPRARRPNPRVGVLLPGSRPAGPSPFEQGLRELGWVEGRTVRFERRYADWQPERLRELAAELVGLRVDVILATNLQAAEAARRASSTIPIVMLAGSDPVARGLVQSLERPGGNVTGLSLTTAEVVGNQLGLMKEALPTLSRLAVLWDASLGPFVLAREARLQAWARDVELLAAEVQGAAELARVLAVAKDAGVGALTVVESPLFWAGRKRLGELGIRHQLPILATSREFAEAGCLFAYGPHPGQLWRRVAALVDRILRGTRPARIPVEHPARYQLVVNMRTARALGVTLPPALVERAHAVIR